MLLENENIKLRALEIADIDDLYSIENNTEDWNNGGNIQPFSRHILLKYIENQTEDFYTTKQLRLVIETKENKRTIGLIDLYNYEPMHKRAWIGILIVNEERQKGFASQALQLIKEYSFDFLQIHQLLSIIKADNENSINLFTKNKFKNCVVLKDYYFLKDKYYDAVCTQCIKAETICDTL